MYRKETAQITASLRQLQGQCQPSPPKTTSPTKYDPYSMRTIAFVKVGDERPTSPSSRRAMTAPRQVPLPTGAVTRPFVSHSSTTPKSPES
ncbi:hypothetical protein ACHHYP_16534 [Achlya hypogyna]|uniref:Uncharacterized protein n=1 Tax=Achlya hypogyna TaxID=1202772 RepID=A0A1V9ZEB0_ACHHY|nr:hypothetical protein ACHHYP_16534 [Achlya hypogyna]